MKTYLYILLLLIPCFLMGQPVRESSRVQMIEVAEMQLLRGNYTVALEWFEKAYQEEKETYTAYKIAETNFKLRDYKEANRWYERVYKKKSLDNEAIKTGRFDYARSLKMVGKFQDASKQFRLLRKGNKDKNIGQLIRAEVEGIKLAAGPSVDKDVSISEAGDNINGLSTEASPVFRNENELYFTALLADESGQAYAQIYQSQRSEEGWSKAKALDSNINDRNEHQGNIAFSSDGNTLYFTRASLDADMLYKSEMLMSNWNGNAWSKPQYLAIINGDYIVKHPSYGLFKGKEGLYFVANKADSRGGFDIYFTKKNEDGSFSEAMNIGDNVNTVGDEVTPFYQDEKLFFSSNGIMNYGGFDVFESRWIASGAKWSRPNNVGLPINSPQDDLYFNLDEKKLNGWLVSNRPSERSLRSSTCCDNIYSIKYKEKVPPPPPPKPIEVDVVFTLKNENNQVDVEGAEMVLIRKQGKEENGVTIARKTNPTGNTFALDLKPEEIYEARFNVAGFEQESYLFNTRDLKKSKTLRYEITMRPKRVPPPPPVEEEIVYINQAIRLNSIYYDYNDDKILPEAEQDLYRLLDLLNNYPTMVIELSSNTDSRGGAPFNEALSQRRADSAKAWLTSKGITDNRIKAVGKGESNLLNQCQDGVECSEEEHRINRRTEFKIIAGPTSIKIRK